MKTPPRQLKLHSADYNQNVHEYHTWMRHNAPVYPAKYTFGKKAYVITRYEDVLNTIRSPKICKDVNTARNKDGKTGGMWLPKSFEPLLENMLNTDDPQHRRLRNLVHKAFTPRMIMQMAPRIEAIAHELLDEALRKPEIELVRDYALPLPIRVIAELLGVPDEDRPKFFAMCQRIVVSPTPFNLLKAVPAIHRFTQYTRELADKKRANPQDDVVSGLVLAEEDGDKLTENELVGMVFLLLVAGHETTVGLLANGTVALLDHPDQLEMLRKDHSLIDSAVEELLRFDGPLETTEMSFAREDFDLRGVTIPQGATVLPAILSANRDETVFDNPDVLDITREKNKHLAFGHGIHYCLGAPLARLEAKIGFCTLIERAPDLRLTIPRHELKYSNIMLIHRFENVPIAF